MRHNDKPMNQYKQITVRFGDGYISAILPDFFLLLPLPNIKALFKLLFTHIWEHDSNRETIWELQSYLPDLVADMERVWKQAAEDKEKLWQEPKLYKRRSEQWYAVKDRNDALKQTATSAKWSYERVLSVRKAFAAFEAKYNIQP